MAVAQKNGTAVTSTSTRNNKGTIRNGGTIAASTKWNSTRVGDTANTLFTTGPKLGTAALAKAVSAGTFAVMHRTRYIMRKVTTYIANVLNDTLQSGASDYGFRHAIHKIESMRTTFLTGLSWTVSTTYPTYTATLATRNTAYGNDDAARPTLAVPGELVYLATGKTPTRDDYKRKNLG